MPLCQDCHRPLTLCNPHFCPVCGYPPSIQELAEYVVHEFLASLQPCVETDQNALVLDNWLVFLREVGQIAIDHAPTAAALDQRVKPEWDSQSKWREAVRTYKDAVPLKAPAAEFCFLLQIVADMRTHYLQRLMTPQTPLELVSDTCAFERYNRVFFAGLRVTGTAAQQTEVDIQGTLRQAVEAMRQELFEGLAWQTGSMQEHPLAGVQEWGNILFSGVMRSMIRPNIPRLWNALVRDGEPYQVLMERLPANVYSAWHDGSWTSLEELRNLIVNQVIEDGAPDTLSNHLSAESLRKAHQEIAQWGTIASSLEEWSAIQDVGPRLDAWAAHAKLSSLEAEALALTRQGFTQEQIGAQLHLRRGTVKTLIDRGIKKMRRVAGE